MAVWQYWWLSVKIADEALSNTIFIIVYFELWAMEVDSATYSHRKIGMKPSVLDKNDF